MCAAGSALAVQRLAQQVAHTRAAIDAPPLAGQATIRSRSVGATRRLERSQTTIDRYQEAGTVQRPAGEAGEPSAGEAGEHDEAAEKAQGGEPSGQAEIGSGEELLG
jgi:hypothetical protein